MFSASAPPATDDDGDDNTIIVIWWWWWCRQDDHHEATLTSRYPGAACTRFFIQTNLTELHCIIKFQLNIQIEKSFSSIYRPTSLSCTASPTSLSSLGLGRIWPADLGRKVGWVNFTQAIYIQYILWICGKKSWFWRHTNRYVMTTVIIVTAIIQHWNLSNWSNHGTARSNCLWIPAVGPISPFLPLISFKAFDKGLHKSFWQYVLRH